MNVTKTDFDGVLIIEPQVHGDHRGFFLETWQQSRYRDAGIDADFVQDNLSRSTAGTLRGLHYQIRHAQGKLVQALLGTIFDVIVDLRRASATFGKWTGITLSDENRRQIYVPPGFAHGFCVISDMADVFYKCTELHNPEYERTLLWNDPELGIDWPLSGEPTLSEKDVAGLPLREAEVYDVNAT